MNLSCSAICIPHVAIGHAAAVLYAFVAGGFPSQSDGADMLQPGHVVIVVDSDVQSTSEKREFRSLIVGGMYVVERCEGERLQLRGFGELIPATSVLPPDEAIELFTERIKLAPDSTHHFDRSMAWRSLRQWDKAIADIDEALRQSPEPIFHDARGSILNDQGDFEAALACYSEALRLKPQSPAWLCNRGLALTNLGRLDEALNDFNRAIELEPTVAISYANRGIAWHGKGDAVKAINDLNEAIRLEPTYANAYTHRGAMWATQGESKKALSDFAAAVRLDPENAGAYFNRAALLHEMGDQEQALSDVTQAIRNHLPDPSAHLLRGRIWQERREFAKAAQDFSAALEFNPNSPDVCNSLAWLLATCPDENFRDGRRAVTFALNACTLTNWSRPSDLDTLAAAYAENGDFDLAIKTQQQALSAVPAEQKDDYQSRLDLYESRKKYTSALP